MANCTSIDPLVTPYVDGELSGGDRGIVDEHLGRCPSCYSRVHAEREIRALIHGRKAGLATGGAPPALRGRCSLLSSLNAGTGRGSSGRDAGSRGPWLAPLAPLALAASLVMLVGGTFVYQATDRSALVMAAELAADHVKCFAANQVLGTHQKADDVEAMLLSGFGWRLHMPAQVAADGFELVGARRCLYGEGRVAHIMYRQQGRDISVFMLPRSARAEEFVDVLGHEAAIWSDGDRTFVVVTRGSRSDVQEIASVVKASFR